MLFKVAPRIVPPGASSGFRGGLDGPIAYAGYVYIENLGAEGYWYARHRYYDPVAGRWITRDPAGYVDGMSLYLYARGNPWMFVDPLGLAACPEDRDFREFNEREQGILLKNRTNEHLVRAYTERERLKRVLATNKNLPPEQRAELEAELRYLETVTATINKVGGPLGKEDTEAVQSLVAAYSQFLDTAGKEIGAATREFYGPQMLFGIAAGTAGSAIVSRMAGLGDDVAGLSKTGATKGSLNPQSGGSFHYSDKISRQMGRRGWSDSLIDDAISSPHATSAATNRATGGSATAYFRKDGSYVVRDNDSGSIIQVSNRKDPGWIPDSTIKNPYIP